MLRLTLAAALLAAPAAAEGPALPAGTVDCRFEAWSNDRSAPGLAVRAAPRGNAAVLGRYPRHSAAEATGEWVEVEVYGTRNGWFLVGGASYGDYGDPPPARNPYAGRGWVRGSALGGQLLAGRFYDAPADAARSRPYGAEPDAITVRAVLDCRGEWVRVATDAGTGWVKGLCNNQATTCG